MQGKAFLENRGGLPVFEMLLPIFRQANLIKKESQNQHVLECATEAGFALQPKVKISLKGGQRKVQSKYRSSIASLCATINSASKTSDVFKSVAALFDFDVEESVVASFVQQCERESAIARDIIMVLLFVSKSELIGLGTDGTSKLDLQRSGIEFELRTEFNGRIYGRSLRSQIMRTGRF